PLLGADRDRGGDRAGRAPHQVRGTGGAELGQPGPERAAPERDRGRHQRRHVPARDPVAGAGGRPPARSELGSVAPAPAGPTPARSPVPARLSKQKRQTPSVPASRMTWAAIARPVVSSSLS